MINPTDTWGLFIWKMDGQARFQIQRIDENPVFASDEEAVEHVYALAAQGDPEALYAALCHGETVETIHAMETWRKP